MESRTECFHVELAGKLILQMFVLMILIHYAAEAGANFTNACVANGLSLPRLTDTCRLVFVSQVTRASDEPHS